MTDRQIALAAITSLNQTRELLERSSDQALHDIAEDIGLMLWTLENLEYFGRKLKTKGSKS